MGRLDHDPLRPGTILTERYENLVEHTSSAPADELVLERLVRAMGLGCVLPLQTITDQIDDAAHNPPIIDTRHIVSQRKIRQ
jgi:hypothetical protein